MELKEVIFKRKSVRSYTGEQISDEELKEILESANASPIGMKRFDEVHLTVVQDKELLNEINSNAGRMFGDETRNVLYNAPTLILVSHKNVNEKTASVAYSDCACVFENMTLTATELGLGSCAIWGATMALNSNKELVNKLNLEEGFVPCCAIVIGKTNDKFEEREKTLDKIKINYIN